MVTSDLLAKDHVFELSRAELDLLPYGVITLNRTGKILRFNYAEAAFARRTVEGTLGREFFTDVAPCTNVQAFKGRFDEFARSFDSGVERFDFTFAFRWGSQDVSITLLRKAEHDEINLVVQGRMQATLDIAPLGGPDRDTIRIDRAVAQSDVDPKTFELGTQELGSPAGWEIGSPEESAWRTYIHPDDAASTQRIVQSAIARRRPYGIEYRLLGADRKQRVVQEHGIFAHGTAGCATVIDVTERRRQEADMWRLAHYDALTGLPNRALLLERIAAAASEARDSGRVAAVIALMISRFDSVNATFGRTTGDELLRLLALRLGESVRGGDTVARLDGEAFVVLLTDMDDIPAVTASAQRILETVSQPFAITGRLHQLAADLGISVAPRNGTDSVALLRAAETAMLASQKGERHRITWFTTDLSAEVETTLRTEDELRAALEREEFVLHYQPIIDIEAGRIVAVEALVRWNHPTRGLVMPGDFITVAERTGLIAELGEWVLREAARQARQWLDRGLKIYVCVNVSTVQFRQSRFVDFVASVLAETGIPPETLELELTESVMVDGFTEVIETLTKLKLTGVRLAIDDFGTGYSSLSYLKYFPIDTLKIDRAFVADIGTDTFDRAIAKAVLTLADELQVTCIAEGVETEEQLEMLRSLGCRRVQGYYFSRPRLPADLASQLFRPPTANARYNRRRGEKAPVVRQNPLHAR